MEHFSEEHSKALLAREWLVKIDSHSSTAYLIVRPPDCKFNSSRVDLSCCMLVTDTKTTWAEVLSAKQFARRWRDCNRLDETLFAANDEEDSWRKRNLELLSTAHTLGGVKDLDFAVVESRYGDFAFGLECNVFKWRWEAVSLGHKASAEILSKHLIMPLISVNHLAFSSADPVCELSEADLEKAVDKMGRTARRTVDTHIRHAVSKPRVATTIQRMTALLNFIPDIPAIISTTEPPNFQVEEQLPIASAERSLSKLRSVSPPSAPIHSHAIPGIGTSSAGSGNAVKSLADSATESENEGLPSIPAKNKEKDNVSPLYSTMNLNTTSPAALPATPKGTSQTKVLESDSESSPARAPKKSRVAASSSDDDSEAERKRRVALLKSGAGPAKRGTKQPVKRGGKRF